MTTTKKQRPAPLDWVGRGTTLAGDFPRLVWRTRCNRYRVERSSCPALPARQAFAACAARTVSDVIPSLVDTSTTRGSRTTWSVISRHRTRAAAVRACELAARGC